MPHGRADDAAGAGGIAAIEPGVALERAVGVGAVAGALGLGGARVSGPFCPQPDSGKAMAINAAIKKGTQPLETKLSDCSDIE